MLIDVPRFIAQIQHHAIGHRLIEFVGMDIRAKYLHGFFLVLLHQRCTGKADKQRIWQDGLHGFMQFAGLSAVTLIDKHKQIALNLKILGQGFFQFFNKGIGRTLIFTFGLPTEFMHQGAHEPRIGLIQRGDQISAAFTAVNRFFHTGKDFFNLLIQLGAVGDDQHSAIFDILPNPLGQPHHGQAFTRALRMPNNAAFTPRDMLFGGFNAKKLVMAAGFFDAGIKHDKVVNDLQEALLVADTA